MVNYGLQRVKRFDFKHLSKELKKRGWKFVGPTTVYAFMQAMGLVNDHVEECITKKLVELF